MNRTTSRPDKVTGASSRPRRAGALLSASGLVVMPLVMLVAACTEGRGAQDPSQQQFDPNNPYAQQQPNPYAQGQTGPQQYPPQQYPQQQPYPQQGTQYPPGYAPQQGGAPQPVPTATVAPSPLALPCQNDLICGTHKCNLQSQRCAFPCAANTDCASGFTCMGAGGATAICIPGAGQ